MLSQETLCGPLDHVEANRGAPGVDLMTTVELRPWLPVHWPAVEAELDTGICPFDLEFSRPSFG
jgi:hypothetical protein